MPYANIALFALNFFHTIISILVFSYLFNFFFNQGDQNYSLSQSQLQVPGNRTIQSFVKAYVDKYIGGYSVTCLMTVLSVDFIFFYFISSEFREQNENLKTQTSLPSN